MRKFIESKNIKNFEVLTDTGWEEIERLHTTIPYEIYEIHLEDGSILKCADTHIVFNENLQEVYVDSLIEGNLLMTNKGPKKVKYLIKTGVFENMYDLELSSSSNKRYYTNEILSHNTELTRAISRYLFHSEDSLIRIDMSEYMEKFNVSKLIGSPPGYVGHENGGILTEKVKKKPYSVILFDEIEKAHPDIYNILLQVLDEGHLTDSLGRKINFKNTLIIMTSNIGMREAAEATSIGFTNSVQKEDEAKRVIIEKSLKKTFSPEFLNRLDEVVYFNRLTKEHMLKILDLHITDLSQRLAEMGYKISISQSVKELVIDKGTDERFGARILQRTVQKIIEDKISEVILKEKPPKGKTFKIDIKKGTTDEIEVLARSKA